MMTVSSTMQIAQRMIQAAEDVKAKDISAIDVSARFPLADVFLVVSGASERHVNGIVEAVEKEMINAGMHPIRREGRSGGRWVLLDYGEVIVHVQHQEERKFYALDRLWSDSPKLLFEPRGMTSAT